MLFRSRTNKQSPSAQPERPKRPAHRIRPHTSTGLTTLCISSGIPFVSAPSCWSQSCEKVFDIRSRFQRCSGRLNTPRKLSDCIGELRRFQSFFGSSGLCVEGLKAMQDSEGEVFFVSDAAGGSLSRPKKIVWPPQNRYDPAARNGSRTGDTRDYGTSL